MGHEARPSGTTFVDNAYYPALKRWATFGQGPPGLLLGGTGFHGLICGAADSCKLTGAGHRSCPAYARDAL